MLLKKTIFHQVIAMAPVNHIWFMIGYAMGWVPQVLSWLSRDLTVEQCSWIGSLYYVGRAVGPFIAAALADHIGRNFLFMMSATFLLVPWLALLSYDSSVVWAHYVARVFVGLGDGITELVGAIYIGENCSPELRGVFNIVALMYFMVGNLAAYTVAAYCSYAVLNSVGAVLASLTLLSMSLLKEPANYLIMRGRFEEAEQNFHWLRGGSSVPNVAEEFVEMKDHIVEREMRERESLWSRVSTPEGFRSLRLVIILSPLIVMTGYSGINSFFTIILSDSQFQTPLELTTYFGLTQFAMVWFSSSIVERYNRRTLLMTSSLVLIVTSLLNATTFVVADHTEPTALVTILKFVFLTAHVGVYISVTFPLLGALRGELLPQNVKAFGCGLAITAGSTGSFIVAQFFLPVARHFGVAYNFVVYAVVAFAGLIYVYLDLPETRGKTLTHIQHELNDMEDAQHEEYAQS